jgi:putative transcriptional regulator
MIRALCAALVLCALSWPASAADAPLTTILLVAQPEIRDPNFKGSVVLVMNNIAPGPVGVIINKPTDIAISHLFPDLENLAPLDDKVYFGGPVDIGMVSFLIRADAAPEHATEVVPGVYLSTNRELLRKLLGRAQPMQGLRILIGYSGWGPGQLEAEVARGGWTLAPATAASIFDRKSEQPWPEQQTPDGERRT